VENNILKQNINNLENKNSEIIKKLEDDNNKLKIDGKEVKEEKRKESLEEVILNSEKEDKSKLVLNTTKVEKENSGWLNSLLGFFGYKNK
jgi:hypothetical protein